MKAYNKPTANIVGIQSEERLAAICPSLDSIKDEIIMWDNQKNLGYYFSAPSVSPLTGEKCQLMLIDVNLAFS